MKIKSYLKEFEHQKFYILSLFAITFLFYSVYLFLDLRVVYMITDEDHFFEWITVLFFIIAGVLSFKLFLKFRSPFFILFFVLFFFAAGEEISWGQRILGVETPQAIKQLNVQEEFNLHNLEIFNSVNQHQESKAGWSRLLEINFLFRVGTLLYGILLPLLVFHIPFVRNFARAINIPVPPVSIGVFFFITWLCFRILHTNFQVVKNGGDEIYESLAALVFMVIFMWFNRFKNEVDYMGTDLKESLQETPVSTPVRQWSKTIYS